MIKISLRKISILGLVLTAASALTAAINSGNSYSIVEDENDGTLVHSTGENSYTCVQDESEDIYYSCNRSIDNTTTTSGASDSFTGVPPTNQTYDNTSASALGRETSEAD